MKNPNIIWSCGQAAIAVLALSLSGCITLNVYTGDGQDAGGRIDAGPRPDGEVPSSCEDGRRNPGESDVDCGGDCAPCAPGLRCTLAEDCQDSFCLEGRCAGPRCDDGILNGEETGVDCGGSLCLGCRDTEACSETSDCLRGRCDEGLCTSCFDGLRNGPESDVDCGGDCGPCGGEQGCATDEDCASGLCMSGGMSGGMGGAGRCAPQTCLNGVRDGDERSVDCGGAVCPPCFPPEEASLSLGETHSCARSPEDLILCWGQNDRGQLGDGTTGGGTAVPAALALPDRAGLALGSGFSCARTAGGEVDCWGQNDRGQLGDGSIANRATPGRVPGLTGVRQLYAGDSHACAILEDGSATCWGRNNLGQLGDGTSGNDRLSPVPVMGLSDVASMGLGVRHSCAILGDGSVWCWGLNDRGQLGAPAGGIEETPVQVMGLSGPATAVAAGRRHSCAALRSGEVECWGQGAEGQLGDGATADSAAPVRVTGLDSVVALDVGENFGCAQRATGELWCWGENRYGVLGDGTRDNRPLAAEVSELGAVLRFATGNHHICALQDHGEYAQLWCWGWNGYRQSGQSGGGAILYPALYLNL